MTGEPDAPREDETHRLLLEENRRLAQRYLELENSSRQQLQKLRTANTLLAKGEAHMRILLENAAIGFALLDLNLRVVSANHTLRDLLGYSDAELTGENFNNFIYVAKLPAFSRLTGHSAHSRRPSDTIEMVARDGRLIPCRMAVSDWLDDDGSLRGSFILAFDIDDELRAVAKLRELEKAMVEAQSARAFFLDVVARELRTPASGVIGMARMLLDTELNERQAELAGVIHSSASSLVHLVDDIVDVSRIDAGDSRPEPVPLRPRELVEGVASLFAVRLGEKGLELRIDTADAVPEFVTADAGRLRRVLAHLVDNAVKFTDRGRITIATDVVGDSIRFMVSDTGSGLAIDPDRNIFDDSVGGDSPGLRRHGGLGVGLSVSHRLVAAMGGKISYETEPEHGSEFHFTIPLIVPEEAPEDVGQIEPPPEAMRLPPLRILLADGNPLSRRLVKAYLQFDGHRLTVADSGLDAVGRCRNGVYDLVILDLHVPRLDGLQTLRLIRDDEKTTGRKRTPVVFLSPPGQARDLEPYERAGADGVVRRPIRPVELMAAAAKAAGVRPLTVLRPTPQRQYSAELSGGSIRRLDGAQLVNLRQVMPNDQFIGLLRFFMEDAVPGLVDLHAMAEKGDPDPQRIAFSAAKARGLAGYLGFAALAELLKRIENAGRTGVSLTELRTLTGELPPAIDDSLEELKRILPDAFATISAMSGPISEGDAG